MEPLDRLFEGLPFDEPHRIVGTSVCMVTQTIDWHDPRVLQPARDLGLQQEPRLADRMVRMLGSQRFQSDLAIEFGIDREEDLAQTALGMGPDDAEALDRRAMVVALLRDPIRPDISDGGGRILRTDRGCLIARGVTGPFDGLALERHI